MKAKILSETVISVSAKIQAVMIKGVKIQKALYFSTMNH